MMQGPRRDAALRWVAPQTIVHWDGVRDFSPPFESPSALVCATPLEDIIWADDLAKCIMVPSADLAAKVAAMECGLLADAFFAHGYTLSFGPAKTAVMLARSKGLPICLSLTHTVTWESNYMLLLL